MKANDFDIKFDEGKEDIIEDMDLSSLKRPNQTPRRFNVDFPEWMIVYLNKEASLITTTRFT